MKLQPHAFGTTDDGTIITHTPQQLAGHHLFLGKSGAGKTNAMRGALVAIAQSDSPITLLDDGRTLFDDACSIHVAHIEELERLGKTDPQKRWQADYERRRFMALIFSSTNYTAISFDLTKLRRIKDPGGDVRLETPKERAEAIYSCLVQQRGDAVLDMNVVAKTAHPLLVLVAAAQLPIAFLFSVLDPYDTAGHATLIDHVRNSEHANDPDVVDALRYFQSITTSVNYWHTCVDTTAHLFGFIRENIDFFEQDSLCYEDFHRDGGHLYVKFQHRDTRANQLMWRFLFGAWSGAASEQELDRPSFFFADDPVRNIDPAVFVDHAARLRNYRAFTYLSLHNLEQFGASAATLLSLMHEVVLFRPVKVEDAQAFIYSLTRADIATKFLPSLTKNWSTTISETETHGVTRVRGSSAGVTRRASLGQIERGKRITTTSYDDEGQLSLSEKSVYTQNLAPYVPDEESTSEGTSASVAVKHDVSHGIAKTEGYAFTMVRVSIQEQLTAEIKALCQMEKHTAWVLSDTCPPVRVKLFPHRSDSEAHPDRIARAKAYFAALHQANTKPRVPVTHAELWFPTFKQPQSVEKTGFQPTAPEPKVDKPNGPDGPSFLR